MFRKRDLALIISLLILIALAVTLFIINRQYFKIGDNVAVIDNASKRIFVALAPGSYKTQEISFNFPFKNNSIYIKRISAGTSNYKNPEEIKIEDGMEFDFGQFISHCKIIVKSEDAPLEYDLWVTTGDIPILSVDTDKNIADEPKTGCNISVMSKQSKYNIDAADSEIELIDIEDGIEKNSYSLNIKENPITGKAPNILDFDVSKRFNLFAMNYDRSLIRQKLASDLFKSLSEKNISPESEFVELYVKGNYMGVYLLSRRVDREMFFISNYNIEDMEHSVIYEALNKNADFSKGIDGFSQIEPDYEKDIPYLDPLENLIDFIGQEEKESFFEKANQIIDIDNLLDNHILFFLTGCTDTVASIQYMYKNNEDAAKFMFLPGSRYISGFGRDKKSAQVEFNDLYYAAKLYNRLYEDKNYREILKKRWNELRQSKLSYREIARLIDTDTYLIADAQKRNFTKWPLNPENADIESENSSFNAEIKYIKNFISKRLIWMDNYMNNPPLLKIGDSYAFINEKENIIFCSLPENADIRQKISWEFSEDTEIFLEPMNCGKYVNFNNNFEKYEELINSSKISQNIIISIESIDELDHDTDDGLKVSGYALNPSIDENTGVEKLLVFNGTGQKAENFLGEAVYGQSRTGIAAFFKNKNYVNCGFTFEIDTLYLNEGITELYIYAYDAAGNYSLKTAKAKVRNDYESIFQLTDTSKEQLINGQAYDFREFIYRGILTIKDKSDEKKYNLIVTKGDVPVVLVNADGWVRADIDRVIANMKIIYNDPGGHNFIDSTIFDFNGTVGIRYRGKNTLTYPKKQFSVEIRDEKGEDKKVSLLGMPEESDWILSAPYTDKSLIRMPLAFSLSNQVGLYASRTEFVELFLYQKDSQVNNFDYMGLYILTETIKRDKNRVDIQKLDSDDDELISGGYILELTGKNQYNPQETYLEADNFQYIVIYPNWKNITEKQKGWISEFMNEFEDTLYGDNFKDRQDGYLKYIDIDSFIDYIIINELFKNKDTFGKSTFMSLDRDSKLKLGPVWDFDLSSGNNSQEPDAKNNIPELFSMPSNRWCNRLFLDSYFVSRYIQRWQDLRKDVLSDNNILNTIENMFMELDSVQERNFARWDILGKYVHPNPPPYAKTHKEAVEQLSYWLLQRAKWIDENIETLHTFADNPEKFNY